MKKNGTMMQYFHWYYGNSVSDIDLWDKVAKDSQYLSNIGITALWLPPAFKGSSYNKNGNNTHEKFGVGYGIYDLYDLGEFNQKGTVRTKYGTKDQYLKAIKTAQANSIDIYADIVFNHKAAADETEWIKAAKVAGDNHNYIIQDELWIEAWTKFNFPGRGGKYSDFKWCYKHFDGVDYAQNTGESAIFKFLGLGKDWDKMVSDENGNYDYLMFSDIDMNHPEVRTEFARWGKWFLKTTGVNGFRLDAIKHIQFSFFRDWLQYLRTNNKNLFAVGEYWSSKLDDLKYYISKSQGCMSLFDAPLQNNFYIASRSSNGQFDMRKILDNTLVNHKPYLAVTLVDNHDTQPCQALERWVDWWFKPLAYAIILLRQEGYPSVFFPDLYGAAYKDKGQAINLSPVPGIEKLIKARKQFAYGLQRNFFNDYHAIGWTREGDDTIPNSGLAVLLTNGNHTSKWMEIGEKHAGKRFIDYLGNHANVVTINSEGWAEFFVNAGSVSVWIEQTAF